MKRFSLSIKEFPKKFHADFRKKGKYTLFVDSSFLNRYFFFWAIAMFLTVFAIGFLTVGGGDGGTGDFVAFLALHFCFRPENICWLSLQMRLILLPLHLTKQKRSLDIEYLETVFSQTRKIFWKNPKLTKEFVNARKKLNEINENVTLNLQ